LTPFLPPDSIGPPIIHVLDNARLEQEDVRAVSGAAGVIVRAIHEAHFGFRVAF